MLPAVAVVVVLMDKSKNADGCSTMSCEEIRQNAERYLWLRDHAIRIQGSDLWYQGKALDIRVDVGRDRMAEQAKPVQEGGTLLLKRQAE